MVLDDYQIVKDAYRVNTSTINAKDQLRIIADMLRDRGNIVFADKIMEIVSKMITINDLREKRKREGQPALG